MSDIDNIEDFFRHIKTHRWGDLLPGIPTFKDLTIENVGKQLIETFKEQRNHALGTPERIALNNQYSALTSALQMLTGVRVDEPGAAYWKVLPIHSHGKKSWDEGPFEVLVQRTRNGVLEQTSLDVLAGKKSPAECHLTWSTDPNSPLNKENAASKERIESKPVKPGPENAIAEHTTPPAAEPHSAVPHAAHPDAPVNEAVTHAAGQETQQVGHAAGSWVRRVWKHPAGKLGAVALGATAVGGVSYWALKNRERKEKPQSQETQL
jgi:hypothetical protein